MLAPLAATALLLLACGVSPSSAVNLRGEPPLPATLHGEQPSPAQAACESLAKVPRSHARPLLFQNQTAGPAAAAPSFACNVEAGSALRLAEEASSQAVCSPVCDEPLDVVVVLGSSEWSLDESDASSFRSAAGSLLKHFALGRARGSLFGFLDVSRGAEKASVLSGLSGDRNALAETLQAWKPLLGGKAVTSLEMQGFEQRPEVLSMLNISRPSVRRTLLVLQLPPKESRAEGSAPVETPHLVGLLATQTLADPFARDRQIMELLVSTCPAVRIDPTLECGRMRWGSADASNNDKLKPWGGKQTK